MLRAETSPNPSARPVGRLSRERRAHRAAIESASHEHGRAATARALRVGLSVALACVCLRAPTAARADATSDAKTLFEAGQKAYSVGDFKGAIQAFEQGYKLDPRPGLLFSIAQAHRRQFAIDKRAGHVAVAVKYFRDYLAKVEQGGRRAEAAAALGELESVALQLEIEGKLQPLEDQEPVTRLVLSSPAQGAVVLLDGGTEPKALPFSGELAPGKHTITVRAPGHLDERRDLEITKGGITSLDLPLRVAPGRLTVLGPSGAQVTIDGRPGAVLPLAKPLEVEPGPRLVRVTLGGHEEFVETLELGKGGEARLTATMPWTTQRKASLGLLGGGALALVGGVLTGAFALTEHATVTQIQGRIDAGAVTCRGPSCPELDQFNGALASRNALGAASGVLLGAAALAGGGGLFLYLTDTPSARRREPSTTPGAPPRESAPVTLEVSAGPLGGFVKGSF